ncbi:MAG: HD domain-containing protein [Armatimonadetes bacterium]|nr:HD domain-containing protein [Armatimonadota bacterium]
MHKLYFVIPALIASFSCLHLGVLSLLLCINKVERRSTLYFSFICFCISWFCFATGMMILAEGQDILFWSRLRYGGMVPLIMPLYLLIESYLETGPRKMMRHLIFAVSLALLAAVPTNLFVTLNEGTARKGLDVDYLVQPGPLYFLFFAVLYGIVFFAIYKGLEALKGLKESDYHVVSLRYFIMGTVVVALLGLSDFASVLNFWRSILLTHYGFFLFCFLFFYRVFKQQITLYRDLKKSYLDTITALAAAIDAKDKYTRGHSERVSKYSAVLASALEMPDERKETVKYASLLHDLGKIGIPDAILSKPGELTESEWQTMKSHVSRGAEILASVDFLERHREIVESHHEKFDGKGYTKGLKGNEIPLEAQIIAIADTFDAMTSDRPYRKGFDPDKAFEEIEKSVGKQFDPLVVAALLSSKDRILTIFKDENA